MTTSSTFSSIIFDVVLCAALLVSLIYYYSNGRQFSTHYLVGFCAFFILFALFLIAIVYLFATEKRRAVLFAVVITIARFLSAIVVVIAWLADYNGPQGEKDENDPYEWISNRKPILFAFTAIYVPIFIVQLFVLNRIYTKRTQIKFSQVY
ncbi:unnamed protein product [Caenorhabditis bovis]|uniref:Uncharacterized protein n=1 Tax=Caenorhabditis bovis TaxID=2654633 RepID=A0A8S1FAE0_9PELO|nr:unnamed protein product [Caenorhabditis bovis]